MFDIVLFGGSLLLSAIDSGVGILIMFISLSKAKHLISWYNSAVHDFLYPSFVVHDTSSPQSCHSKLLANRVQPAEAWHVPWQLTVSTRPLPPSVPLPTARARPGYG